MINYYLLTKPGIILGNLITVLAGFWLASKGTIDLSLLLYTAFGLICIIGSACAFNNFLDRELDKKMDRTKNRALVQGSISTTNALLFAFALALIGNLLLYQTNWLTLLLADLGLLIYVFPYSMWKKETIYGTAIGSIAGALPPVIGYTAVSGTLDFTALLLFTLLILWQMPHFYALAIYYFEDYKKAGVPLLPQLKGILRTQLHMHLYILALTLLLFLLPVNRYLVVALVALSTFWLALSLQGFVAKDKERWGRQMFQFSLVMINALCFGIIAIS